MFRRSQLESIAATAPPGRQARALLALGRFADLAEAVAGWPADPLSTVVAAQLAAARGEFVVALELLADALLADALLADESPQVIGLRARLLSFLGQTEEALHLVADASDPRLRWVRAGVHLAAGELSAAELSLPKALPGEWGSPELDDLERAELDLTAGEIAVESRRPHDGLDRLMAAYDTGRRLGAASVTARALSRLGEAHADLRHRWRALRCTVRAVDLAASGTVDVMAQPGIHFRAFQVYGMLGHRALADAQVESGHHLVIQLASGISDRDWRESFFLENRDCQRLVAAWKGDAAWGDGVPR